MEFEFKYMIIILSSIVTGLFTLGAVFLTNKINSSNSEKLLAQVNLRERNNTKLSKLEELYVKFDKWSQSFSGVCFKFLHLSGVVDKGELTELALEGKTDVKGEYIELKMLVSIHFPELKADLSLVFESRDKCAELFGITNRSSELEAEMVRFELVREEFKKQIEIVSESL